MVAPLNLQKLDTSGKGGSEGFFQDTDGYFTIGEVFVDIHRSVIDVFENLRLLRNFQTLP
jgi:hypothetical protein